MRSTPGLSAQTRAGHCRHRIIRFRCRLRQFRISSESRFLPLLVLFVMTLGTAGCTAVGPDFTKPSAPVAGSWIEKDDPKVKTVSADYSQWWTVFEDPILNNLVRIAYTNNPNLQVAGLRILEAKGHLKHTKRGREFVYQPRRRRERAGRSALQRVLHTFFEGSLEKAVAAHLADPAAEVSSDELQRLSTIIRQAKPKEE